MSEKAHIQTVAVDFSTRREQEPPNEKTEQRIVVSEKQVIVTISVVSVNWEQWHKSSENNKKFN